MTGGKCSGYNFSSRNPTAQRPPQHSSQQVLKILLEVTMKLLIVTLALIFTGSQAFVLSDEPAVKATHLKQELHEYKINLSKAVDEKTQLFSESEVKTELLHLAEQAYARLYHHWTALKTELAAELSPEVMEEIHEVFTELREWSRNISHILEESARKARASQEKLEHELEAFVDSLLERVAPYTDDIRRDVLPRTAHVNEKLNEHLKRKLQELLPHTKKLHSPWQQFLNQLDPFVSHVQEAVKAGVRNLAQVVQPYLDHFVEKRQKHAP